MEQIINLCEFVVKKNYIKTVEDFAKIIEQEYKINPWDEGIGIKSLIIIKNYLTTVEFTKIINNFNKTSLSFITRMNLYLIH